MIDELDDEFSLIQNDHVVRAGVDRSKILAWDTILAMDVNTEKDDLWGCTHAVDPLISTCSIYACASICYNGFYAIE